MSESKPLELNWIHVILGWIYHDSPPLQFVFPTLSSLLLLSLVLSVPSKEDAQADVRVMSRSPSPASSLDYLDSAASGSEEEYNPSSRRRAPNKRVVTGKKGGPSLKINLSALQRARDVAATHLVEGDVDDDDGADWQDEEGLVGSRGIDFSGQALKEDHAIRPLWVDDSGNMYVLSCWPT